MFNAYKRFFAFAGKQKKTWYKGMGYELLRSIFEAIQFIALLVVLRALVEQNVTGETALAGKPPPFGKVYLLKWWKCRKIYVKM